jgi:hypothetical protein
VPCGIAGTAAAAQQKQHVKNMSCLVVRFLFWLFVQGVKEAMYYCTYYRIAGMNQKVKGQKACSPFYFETGPEGPELED